MRKDAIVTNTDRADGVDAFLREFADRMGLSLAPEPDGDGAATVAGDLICNILHWVEKNDSNGRLAALQAMRSGIGHYVSESGIDYGAEFVDELGPDAYVSIEVTCNGETWTSETGQSPEIERHEPVGRQDDIFRPGGGVS